ncbi:hypothetical protein BX611_1255 [Lutibacter oceani]|uniref:Uncharacterized protein n=1 Tax=Lutibacter oceani TaxID=1853311 RepID=A0A3D9RP82_9FLAO|nr:hypothetical protein [Lutibacter oceani]REE81719.1 hypothetical protein BX611_1255 [Lutibacter oceani]
MKKIFYTLLLPILILLFNVSCSNGGDSVDAYQSPGDLFLNDALSGSSTSNAVLRINKDVFDTINSNRLNNLNEGDFYTINEVNREGDFIQINLSYAGGCEQHDFQIIWDGIVYTDNPCHMNLLLIHNANNDYCEALITQTVYINLKELVGEVSYKDSCAYYIFSTFNSSEEADAIIN